MSAGTLPRHTKIFIGLFTGLAAGIACNILLPDNPAVKWIAANIAFPVGQIFLRLIFMVVVPLIFSALALGVADIGDVRKLGRIGIKTLLFTIVITACSVLIGMGLANAVQPGRGISAEDRARLSLVNPAGATKIVETAAESKTAVQTILDLIPKNPIQDMVFAFDPSYRGGGLLAVMVFALLFGIAMTGSAADRMRPLAGMLQGLYDVSMKIIDYAMRLAPFAVACLLFNVTSQLGLQIFAVLSKYILVVIAALAIHNFITYGLIVRYGAKRNPLAFFRNLREVTLTAFSTSSSNATLPTSLRVAKDKLGLHPDIANFVLTLGSTANQNGTALYEGITVLFLAQFYGVELSFAQQLVVILMAVLAGIGTAGVPGGSLPLVVIVLQTVGIPAEGIGIILGVDRILDMSRTVVNVTGDITLAAWVNASEGRDFITQGAAEDDNSASHI